MWAVLLSYLGNGGKVLFLKSCLTIVTWQRVFTTCGRFPSKVRTLTFLRIKVFAFCILYYLCVAVYVLFIVCVTLPPGICPIAVGNKYIYIIYKVCDDGILT
jgi:hypothetical protein